MGLLSLLQSNPLIFVVVAVVLLLSLTVHEWAHAYTADRLGDPTPRREGRVTLDPLAHLDPFGTLLLLLVGFGFAKPVPVNMFRLGRWGNFLVAAAGPLSNIVIAGLALLLLRFGHFELESLLGTALMYVISINIVLAVFNLIPIPPLDGSRIFGSLFPPLGRAIQQYEMQPYSFLISMLLIFFVLKEPIGQVIGAVRSWVFGLVF